MNNNQIRMNTQQNFIIKYNEFCKIEEDWLKGKKQALDDEDKKWIEKLRMLPCVRCANANRKNIYVGKYFHDKNNNVDYYIPIIFCKIIFSNIISTDDEYF